jgi:hypothetical protein
MVLKSDKTQIVTEGLALAVRTMNSARLLAFPTPSSHLNAFDIRG